MIYPQSFEKKTGFDRIRELLSDYCSGITGKELASEIGFSKSFTEIGSWLDQTWEMQQLIKSPNTFYVDNTYDIRAAMNKVRIEGAYTTEEELFHIRKHLEALREVIVYFRKSDEHICPVLKQMASGVKYYQLLLDAIDRIVDKNGVVKDSASPGLREIRTELSRLRIQVTRKLQSVLKSSQSAGIVEPDASIAIRNGRSVIPVNVYNKRKISGLVHDQSASGKTVYIEPAEVVELNNDIFELEYEEKREVVRILISISDVIRPYIDDLLESASYMALIDFIRAKAVLGEKLGSVRPLLRETPHMNWFGARHPLLALAFERLPDRTVVSQDIRLDTDSRIIVISGPNAGGKSVCLKTAGLLQYMLQCGLTIPVLEGSEAGVFFKIFIDIGDEQSIENDLSTYSSHLLSMKYFLRHSGEDTLVLIDEFGAGTEPVIGGAIAEAILAELNSRFVFGIITTHYTNLKHFASNSQGIVNGAMAFDNHLMQPLFRLVTGKPGSSFAFEIARKIGLPDKVLEEASSRAGKENVVYDKFLRDIARDRRYWEKKRESIRRQERKLEQLELEYESGLKTINEKKKEIIAAAQKEAKEILSGSNRIIENTIREIRESEADKTRTREARQKLEEFREELKSRTNEQSSVPVAKPLPIRPTMAKERTKHKEDEVPDKQKPLVAGSYVKMSESESTGLVEDILDHIAVVSFGNVTVKLPLEKLRPSTKTEYDRGHRSLAKPVLDWDRSMKKSGFHSQLDLRGMKAEEALHKVQEFLDHAWMISYPTVHILHGKGFGILRQQIRQYLSTLGYIRSFDDAPVEQGGTGITVVDMDV